MMCEKKYQSLKNDQAMEMASIENSLRPIIEPLNIIANATKKVVTPELLHEVEEKSKDDVLSRFNK